MNLLDAVLIPIFTSGKDITLNFLGEMIRWLITHVGVVGWGIIVYSLILKTVVLPLDIYSKVVSRKQSLKMEEMRPQLEKLQKQYANDKTMYSQKMMELYKKNHYSVFSACIPSIVMIVVFIIVFNAFNAYSQYANLSTYNAMIEEYNGAVRSYSVELVLQDGAYTVPNADRSEIEIGGVTYERYVSREEDRFIYMQVSSIYVEGETISADAVFEYYIDTETMLSDPARGAEVRELYANRDEDAEVETLEDACLKWVKLRSRAAAERKFVEEEESFLWIKNIWYADTTIAHPVREYSSFVNSITSKINIDGTKYRITEYPNSPYQTSGIYDEITYNLSKQKDEGNGYYIMIVLSIGTMVLSQFITSRMQKAQTELQSVDGSGKTQMKMMMIMMPIIYGVFSFGYSSAFSIYMVTSNIYGTITSLLITWIVDAVFKANAKKAFKQKYEKRYRAAHGILETETKKKKK